jgi:integrase/recombinase XerD
MERHTLPTNAIHNKLLGHRKGRVVGWWCRGLLVIPTLDQPTVTWLLYLKKPDEIYCVIEMGKTNRNGQAASLTPEQLDTIIAQCAPLFQTVLSMCRFTACRVTESLSLRWENVLADCVVFPRAIVKKKTKTRSVPINAKLQLVLEKWREAWPQHFGRKPEKSDYLFPKEKNVTEHLLRQRVDDALRQACARAGLGNVGVSTHSLRRSALTQASAAGIPTRSIQVLSGHSSLEQLQRYIDTTDEQKKQAANTFG